MDLSFHQVEAWKPGCRQNYPLAQRQRGRKRGLIKIRQIVVVIFLLMSFWNEAI